MSTLRPTRVALLATALFTLHLLPTLVGAEPYLAVREGLQCSACHTNPTGGAKRTAFGRIYGQTVLPTRPGAPPVDQRLSAVFDVGADLRFSASGFAPPDGDSTFTLETERASLYLESTLIPDRMKFYIDQQFGPASDSREAWVLFEDKAKNYYVKAGRMWLPFGYRLLDDSALVRTTSGINMLTPDNAIEVGVEKGSWSTQVALSNGGSGNIDNNTGKRLTARTVYVDSDWRLGASASYNEDSTAGDRSLLGVFSGARLFDSELLFEVDVIRDGANSVTNNDTTTQLASLMEINHEISKGRNLKLAFEYLDPDIDLEEDHNSRLSLIYEATPIPLLQIRLGARIAEGIPQSVARNTDSFFLQLHGWY